MNTDQFPFQVSLSCNSTRLKRLFVCSGAFVSPKWILTSASCLTECHEISIRLGSITHYTGGRLLDVGMWHIHPHYNLTIQQNDLALLQAQYNENFPYINPNLYPLVPVKSYRLVVSIGYGYLAENVVSPALQFEYGQIIDNSVEICQKESNELGIELNESVFCVQMLNQQDDSCATDPGSPLLVQYYGGWIQTGTAIGTRPCNGRIRFYTNLSKSMLSSFIAKISRITYLEAKEVF